MAPLESTGAVINFLPAASLVFLLLILSEVVDPSATSPELQTLLAVAGGANAVFLLLRYFVRVGACHQVYGVWDPLGIALRWTVAIFVNMAAVWRAWFTWVSPPSLRARSPGRKPSMNFPKTL